METAPSDAMTNVPAGTTSCIVDARLRLRSPSDPRKRMSRREVAEAMNAYLWVTYRQRDNASAAYIGYYESPWYADPALRPAITTPRNVLPGAAGEAFTSIQPGQEPEWLGTLDKGELLAQYGRVYRDMARADSRHGDAAVAWVTDTIAAFGHQNVRSTVLNQIGLCSAHFLAGEPGEAVREGCRAQRQAAGLASPRVLERLANLRRDGRRFAGNRAVDAFLASLPRPAAAV